ncbi:MAG: helix-turn-helix transcriptional regulator [Hungatella hathewayi]|nr:helix-turn-helix transcriptional regulator [Hungatella hathewayi]
MGVIMKMTGLDLVRRIIGDKWKILIICHLFNGTNRLSTLMYYIDGITQKVLTENLRQLEKDKIIYRTVIEEKPLKVEYSLTEIGISLKPIIESLIAWSLEYNAKMNEIE